MYRLTENKQAPAVRQGLVGLSCNKLIFNEPDGADVTTVAAAHAHFIRIESPKST